MSTHLGDELELYALGDLSPEERADVEEHLATCEECVRALAAAEDALAQMTALLPAYRAPRRTALRSLWTMPVARMAIAAAFVVGLLVAAGTLPFLTIKPGTSNQDARAQIAMTHAHFEHVQLTPLVPGAPAVKVIYARDRSWIYAIADDGRPGYHLYLAAGSSQPRDLGELIAHDGSASLFVEQPPAGNELLIVSNGRALARGMLP
ncbi:MAG TPA: zf-HC2 domain-containing protein [Candidatus Acidoferrales bacterium]|nr:zf-HC2 domain-containing protein [Candidatus Acidoferrales bacterium]